MLKLRPNNQLHALYANSALGALGMSFVYVFLYLYFYTLGFSVDQILLYMLVRSVWVIVASSLTGHAIARFGPKRVMTAGCLIQIAFFVLLLGLTPSTSLLYLLTVIAAAEALSNNIYWIGRMVYEADVIVDRQAGQQLSSLDNFATVAYFIGPLLGGLLAQHYGFAWPTIVAFGFMVLSTIPLLASPDPQVVRGRLRQRAMLAHFRSSWRNFAIEGVHSVNYLAGTLIWGLYVGVIVLSEGSRFSGLGIIMAIVTVVSVLVSRLIGKLDDRGRGERILAISILGELALIAWRLFIKAPWQVVTHNVLQSQANRGIDITLSKGSIHDAKSHQGLEKVEYFVLRETVAWIIRSAFTALLVIFALGFDFSEGTILKVGFVAGGLLLPLLFLHHYSDLRRSAKT